MIWVGHKIYFFNLNFLEKCPQDEGITKIRVKLHGVCGMKAAPE
jgi:hypothetical protein